MRRLLLALAVALSACGAREAGNTPADAARAIPDPAPVVRAIYEPYLDAEAAPRPLIEAAPWSRSLSALIEGLEARVIEEEAPILDFDPLIDAQDWQLSDVSAETESLVEASHASVRARFTNSGAAQEVSYDLIWEDERWKVDNVRGPAWDLRSIITPVAPPPAP